MAMNGGLNLSILDGWWIEGYNGENGFSIGAAKDETETDEATIDAQDAESLYRVLENEVIPTYYKSDSDGLPSDWIKRMKDWEKTDYHQPEDKIKPDWAWEGAEAVAEVMGIMGLRIANSDSMPEWLKTSRFADLKRGNTKEISEEK